MSKKLLGEATNNLAESKSFFDQLTGLFDRFSDRAKVLENREIGLSGVVEDYR